ncbi:hypothetical protein FOL47_011130, partial [Perkinsus chesapeaki]
MSQFPLAIPPEVSAACDAHHVAKLYCVCRFCYGRIPPTAGKARTSPPGKTTCERAVEFYDIDFISELANLRVPKVLCPSCQVRLSGLALGKLDVNEWREQKRFFVQAPVNTSDPLRTRSKDICSADDRCRVCTIACSRKSIAVERSKSFKPSVGRPLEQSPQKDICNNQESARDLLRLGHLGLGRVAASELCQILRREGISFPDGGLRQAVDEKWDVFGPLFACETLDLQEAAQ